MDRIVELVERLETLEPPAAREDARDLVREILTFHGEALRRLVAAKSLAEAARDPLVASMLELHDVSPGPAAAVAQPDPGLVPAASLVRKLPAAKPAASPLHEQPVACDLCGAPAAEEHPHLFDVEARALKCVCQACGLVMRTSERLRRVPERVTRVRTLGSDDAAWARLGLPVGLAFFVRRSGGDEVEVHYPGMVGTVTSSVPLDVWREVASGHPAIADLAEEVEALVVNRIEGAREHWIVGIDRAFELAGRVRATWRGFTGGEEVRAELSRYFLALTGETARA
jgi:hypothetical protein